MKKLVAIYLFVISGNSVLAQEYLTHDSVSRQELSVSVLPIINAMSGSLPRSTLTNFNFGYKYYFKNRWVIRTALVLFPKGFESPFYAGLINYHSSVGYKNIFSVYNVSGSIKTQLNLGIEKLYRYNRLVHGLGIDAFVNHVKVTYRERYFFRYPNQSLVWSSVSDTTNYTVDTLGYARTEKRMGVGLQAFYSVRYKISKRLYLSATLGPSINFSFVNSSHYDNRTKETHNGRSFLIDFPNVGFISDISICFRL